VYLRILQLIYLWLAAAQAGEAQLLLVNVVVVAVQEDC
jgi:hypothetical protein